ncbi:MAG TPA: hypothetical protein ENJ80_10255 [Gammaproteobacteria bacterium]|nr:hypothetical protein [Gammaproteobacteria bacterium]
MNLAFQALLFFILLLPGLLLRSNYNGRIAKELVLPQNFPPFSREAIRILIYAAILNVLWVTLSNYIGKYHGFHTDLESVIFLLMGDYSDSGMRLKAIAAITDHPGKVLLYFSSLYIVSAWFGFVLHKRIRQHNLDKKYQFLRFNNQWHYLLTGEVMEFTDECENPSEVDFVSVSAVVDTNHDTFLYVGTVVDYDLDSRGDLARLTLAQTYRRKLSADQDQEGNGEQRQDLESDPRYYRIKGDYFLLGCENARNLNIDYWYLTEQQDTVDNNGD